MKEKHLSANFTQDSPWEIALHALHLVAKQTGRFDNPPYANASIDEQLAYTRFHLAEDLGRFPDHPTFPRGAYKVTRMTKAEKAYYRAKYLPRD